MSMELELDQGARGACELPGDFANVMNIFPEREEDDEVRYETVRERSVRLNTVRIDLSRLPTVPCAFQMQEFLGRTLEVTPEDVCRLQWCRRERCLFVKMRTQAAAEQLVGAHSGRHRFPAGNYRQRIPLSLEDGTTDVMLHDLSELVDHDDIRRFLERYGVVQGIAACRWPCDVLFAGVDNGKLVVRMVVRRPIPRVVCIAGEETLVTYDGQPPQRTSLLAGLGRALGRCFGCD